MDGVWGRVRSRSRREAGALRMQNKARESDCVRAELPGGKVGCGRWDGDGFALGLPRVDRA